MDTFASDVRSSSRPVMKSAELGFPIIGLKVVLERAAKEGRHAAARALEDELKGRIHSDVAGLADAGNGLMSGLGTIYVNAYGAVGSESPAGGRVTLFANHTTSDGLRVAICLFGSKDNFDPSIQDVHPKTVQGVASSPALDVMAWIQRNREFPSYWGEPVGYVAYKIAAPDGDMPLSSHNYGRVAMLKQDSVEWFAHIYHVWFDPEKVDPKIPFDRILVGRPIWARAQCVAVSTAAVGSQHEDFGQSYSRYWKSVLRLDGGSDGWPVYLYRILLTRQGVTTDL